MPDRTLLSAIILVCALGVHINALAGTGHAFKAEYEVLVDGKPRLETSIEMTRVNGSWVLNSEGRGTRGLARMLRVGSNEISHVEWSNGRFSPLEFHHHSKVAGRDERWSAEFDYAADQLLLHHEEGTDQFQISPGAWDPLSLTLELRRRLAAGETDFEVRVADEDEVDTHHYRASASTRLHTDIGCMTVIELERIRENSSRYSRAWYAAEHDFMPLRIQHGKTGGKDFDMRIQKLVIDGAAVQSADTCQP
ncbi:MAG: DUF3108 domain-containing protein [Xanthomonadales bacterium]|nr:DUF3108 domain-containing protein [Xanthomonadales bacterium]